MRTPMARHLASLSPTPSRRVQAAGHSRAKRSARAWCSPRIAAGQSATTWTPNSPRRRPCGRIPTLCTRAQAQRQHGAYSKSTKSVSTFHHNICHGCVPCARVAKVPRSTLQGMINEPHAQCCVAAAPKNTVQCASGRQQLVSSESRPAMYATLHNKALKQDSQTSASGSQTRLGVIMYSPGAKRDSAPEGRSAAKRCVLTVCHGAHGWRR